MLVLARTFVLVECGMSIKEITVYHMGTSSPPWYICQLILHVIHMPGPLYRDIHLLYFIASGHLSTRAVTDRHTVLSLIQMLSSSAGMWVSFLNSMIGRCKLALACAASSIHVSGSKIRSLQLFPLIYICQVISAETYPSSSLPRYTCASYNLYRDTYAS